MMINYYNPWFLRKNQQIGLLMQIDDDNISKMYKFDSNEQINSGENCGINLLLPSDITVPANARSFAIDYFVSAESSPEHGYWLIPRSSIAKTENDTLRQSNSVGLIDSPYRGHLIGKVDNLSDIKSLTKKKEESIYQLVMYDLKTNWKIQKVPLLSLTARGTAGFGSTGE